MSESMIHVASERQIYQAYILSQLLKKGLISDSEYGSTKRKLFKTHPVDENKRAA